MVLVLVPLSSGFLVYYKPFESAISRTNSGGGRPIVGTKATLAFAPIPVKKSRIS